MRLELTNSNLIAARALDIYKRPERVKLLPLYWQGPEIVGQLEAGEEVQVLAVKETALWWRREVWLELWRANTEETVWFRLGPSQWASGALWCDWRIVPNDDCPARC